MVVEAEGNLRDLERFRHALKPEAPPRAAIESISPRIMHVQGDSEFVIQPSLAQPDEFQLVSPDTATCDDCAAEVFDPADRRFRYPFTNCTNCGPRFTIIDDMPYDRLKTTMKKFEMCPDCRREYEDPNNRRFHAQPNACPVCGPKLSFIGARLELMGSSLELSVFQAPMARLAESVLSSATRSCSYHALCNTLNVRKSYNPGSQHQRHRSGCCCPFAQHPNLRLSTFD